MKKLLCYLKPYRAACSLGPLLKLAEATLELLVPFVIMYIVDRGVSGNDRPLILRCTLLLIGMGLVGLLFSVSAQYFSAKAAVGFSSRIREALFSHIQSLGYREIDQLGQSTLITRLTSDVNQIQTAVNLTLRLFLRSPFIVFGAMIMAFCIDAGSALIFAVVIPVLFAAVFAILLTGIPLYKKVQNRLDGIVSRTRQNLTGARTLRALCLEDSETAEFREKNEELDASQRFVGRISALLNPLTYVLINAAIIVLIYRGALRVNYGSLSQAAVLALYNYMSQILIELIKLANLIISITRGSACANRVASVLDCRPSLTVSEDTSPMDPEAGIVFSHVSFRYTANGDNALNDVSFTVKPGETVGVIGGTGSGKSTLVQLLCRFYEPTEGEILFNGRRLSSYPSEELLTGIGVVPQYTALFHGTVRSNLLFGKEDASEDEMWQALTTAQAADFVREKPRGLDAPVEQGGLNFSGGQRQRLTIARALIRKPSLLILDDSSSALDYRTDLAFRHALRSLSCRPTVFLVSQRIAALNSADKIIVLDEGNLVGIGTAEELLRTCDVFREICASQRRQDGDAA